MKKLAVLALAATVVSPAAFAQTNPNAPIIATAPELTGLGVIGGSAALTATLIVLPLVVFSTVGDSSSASSSN